MSALTYNARESKGETKESKEHGEREGKAEDGKTVKKCGKEVGNDGGKGTDMRNGRKKRKRKTYLLHGAESFLRS
jgi:hypothetical protein